MIEIAPLRHKLYVIENGTLDTLAGSERFLREFPFLRGLKQVQRSGGGCGSCGGGVADRTRAETYAAAKRTLAGMDSTRKRKLKELLNAKEVRIVYTTANGKSIKLTF